MRFERADVAEYQSVDVVGLGWKVKSWVGVISPRLWVDFEWESGLDSLQIEMAVVVALISRRSSYAERLDHRSMTVECAFDPFLMEDGVNAISMAEALRPNRYQFGHGWLDSGKCFET